jgi:hypothetical protein
LICRCSKAKNRTAKPAQPGTEPDTPATGLEGKRSRDGETLPRTGAPDLFCPHRERTIHLAIAKLQIGVCVCARGKAIKMTPTSCAAIHWLSDDANFLPARIGLASETNAAQGKAAVSR